MAKRLSACNRSPDLVWQMNKGGESLTAIGRAVGTTRHRVKEFLRHHGETRAFPYSWKGPRCNQWKGGRIVDEDGYVLVYCPGHPHARNPDKRYVLEHRLVMEKHMGRYLTESEVVHHRNDHRSDNRIENLQLFSENREHLRATLTGKCPRWGRKGIRRMKQGVARSANLRRTYTRPALKPGEVRSPGIGIRLRKSLRKGLPVLLRTGRLLKPDRRAS